VLDSRLHIRDRIAGVALVPLAIEVLGCQAELDDEVGREVLRPDLAALLLPEPDQRFLVLAHDDASIGAPDEVTAIIATVSYVRSL
jgi:hypothetical protein